MTDDKYPDAPGYTDLDTSLEAAEAIKPAAERLREQAYKALCKRPMTADECAGVLGESVLSIRPRITELFKTGRIVDTGERRRNESGRRAKVMRAAATQGELF